MPLFPVFACCFLRSLGYYVQVPEPLRFIVAQCGVERVLTWGSGLDGGRLVSSLTISRGHTHEFTDMA